MSSIMFVQVFGCLVLFIFKRGLQAVSSVRHTKVWKAQKQLDKVSTCEALDGQPTRNSKSGTSAAISGRGS